MKKSELIKALEDIPEDVQIMFQVDQDCFLDEFKYCCAENPYINGLLTLYMLEEMYFLDEDDLYDEIARDLDEDNPEDAKKINERMEEIKSKSEKRIVITVSP